MLISLLLVNFVLVAIAIWLLVTFLKLRQVVGRSFTKISDLKDEISEKLKPLWDYQFKHEFLIFEQTHNGRFIWTGPKRKG